MKYRLLCLLLTGVFCACCGSALAGGAPEAAAGQPGSVLGPLPVGLPDVYRKVFRRILFNGSAGEKPPGPPPSGHGPVVTQADELEAYRLAGIMKDRSVMAVVEERKTGKVFYLVPGDSLDGALLVAVDERSVVFEKAGRRLTMGFPAQKR